MYKLKVESMNCMSCFHNINDALCEVDPKALVKAEIKDKTITVESELSLQKVTEILESAGYPGQPMSGS